MTKITGITAAKKFLCDSFSLTDRFTTEILSILKQTTYLHNEQKILLA